MVYRSRRRPAQPLPLRLSPAETAEVVEERGVRCTHFDAFRFFTPAARPLNLLQPTRERSRDLEQPGCLHANMDLYKWAYKLSPLVRSELVADCFALAREIRELDMRASPYDLADLGYPPVRDRDARGPGRVRPGAAGVRGPGGAAARPADRAVRRPARRGSAGSGRRHRLTLGGRGRRGPRGP